MIKEKSLQWLTGRIFKGSGLTTAKARLCSTLCAVKGAASKGKELMAASDIANISYLIEMLKVPQD